MIKESEHSDTKRHQNTGKRTKAQWKMQTTMDLQNNQKMMNKITIRSPHSSKITLNVNKLNSLIK